MDPMTSHLDEIFGSFPEAVLLLDNGQVIYTNEPGQALPPGGRLPPRPAGRSGRAPRRRHGDRPGPGILSGNRLSL